MGIEPTSEVWEQWKRLGLNLVDAIQSPQSKFESNLSPELLVQWPLFPMSRRKGN
jgi:hypothetical protein